MTSSAFEGIPREGEGEAAATCPICGSRSTVDVLRLPSLPTMANRLFPTAEEARRAPRGEVVLSWCATCHHLWNRLFRPELLAYDESYDNALDCSEHFGRYADRLAAELVDRYALEGGAVLEIGAGDGGFLRLLSRAGVARAVGVDPSAPAEAAGEVELIKQYFEPRHAALAGDLVYLRHVLEHLPDPRRFVADLADGLATATRSTSASRSSAAVTASERPPAMPIFVEVPNGELLTGGEMVWDVIYEHFSYFTPTSLRTLFELHGFAVNEVSPAYSGQYLHLHGAAPPSVGWAAAESKPGSGANESGTPGAGAARTPPMTTAPDIGRAAAELVVQWRERAAAMRQDGRRMAVWGAGSKGITFVNLIGAGEEVPGLVDINPRKQGRFVPGTGHRVLEPEELERYRPDLVMLANPVYEGEVKRDLDRLGVVADVGSL